MRSIKDDLAKVTRALPNGAAAVTSASIDTGKSTRGDHVAGMELLLSAPALTVGQQPNDKTLIYDILGSEADDLSAPTVTVTAVITQLGAAGAGAAAGQYRYALPSNGPRYWGFKATGDATGNATTATGTIQLVF